MKRKNAITGELRDEQAPKLTMRQTLIALILLGTFITSLADEIAVYKCPDSTYTNDPQRALLEGCKKLSAHVQVIPPQVTKPLPAPTREERYESCLHDAAMKAPTESGLKIATDICKKRFDKSK